MKPEIDYDMTISGKRKTKFLADMGLPICRTAKHKELIV